MDKFKKFKNSFSVGGALIGLIVLFIVFSILSPAFLKLYNITNILRQSLSTNLTVGMTFVILTAVLIWQSVVFRH